MASCVSTRFVCPRASSKTASPPAELWKKLSACASDPVVGVRYQLAFTLGEIRHPERLGVLAQIARRDAAEPMMRAAVLSSLAEGAGEMFSLLANETVRTRRRLVARKSCVSWPRWWEPPTSRPIWRACGRLWSRRAIPWSRFPLARGLGDGLRRAGSSFEKAGVIWNRCWTALLPRPPTPRRRNRRGWRPSLCLPSGTALKARKRCCPCWMPSSRRPSNWPL